jgi:hypothetical protein
MKRDLEKVRELLFSIEENDYVSGLSWYVRDPWWKTPSSENDGREVLSDVDQHHLLIMEQAELVRLQPFHCFIYASLTWEGHDYLDAVREEGIWASTKSALTESGGSAAIELVKSIATAFARKKIEQHTGLKL